MELLRNDSRQIQLHKVHRNNCQSAKGVVVVIDVIRAFTTAAFAFFKGAEKIILVKEVEDAFKLKTEHPEYLLMGEAGGGYPVEGFDFSNSPEEIANQDFKGKTLVQRTSSGTQGVIGCAHVDRMLISSFVVAGATFKRLKQLCCQEITFIITGEKYGGHEDYALADYLEELMLGKTPNPELFLQRVLNSPSAKFALETLSDQRCIEEDLKHVVDLDKFPFAMEVKKENGLQVARPVYV